MQERRKALMSKSSNTVKEVHLITLPKEEMALAQKQSKNR